MKERYGRTQRSWEFLFCCSRVKLYYFKNPTVIEDHYGNGEYKNSPVTNFAFLFFSFRILENNFKTPSK